ncbi:MAG: excinuclease ABC subunit UvrC [Planctomycetota bacterium]|nr:excinuclease ABC subunit UvrC [Planctomycetota bacterium]
MSAGDPRERLGAVAGRAPSGPGVYRWLDESGRVLYVGKAANLRARVRTYLGARGDGRPLVHLLMRRAADLDVIATSTAAEALLLENTLIKQHRPPYNLRLKDDKSYLLVRVDRQHEFPRLRLVRKVKRDGALYLGPFASAKGVRRTLRFLRTIYPLRTCTDRELAERRKPCLYHQIGRCAAPCVGLVTPEAYGALLSGALAVLRGRDDGVLDGLVTAMESASAAREYERAAILRDRHQALESALARQETVSPDGKDRDVVAVVAAGGVAMLGVVYVRDGHVVATRALPQRTSLDRGDLLHAFLSQFYLRGKVIPAEILLEEEPPDLAGLEAVLTRARGGPVRVRVPTRGAGRELLTMAHTNAKVALGEHSARARLGQEALERLADLLGLAAAPARIEGFDLSHLRGTDPVAGMSVLVGGTTEPGSYRHFAIREAPGGDDYAGMAEVIGRRFRAGLALGPAPQLLLIDGGRGQLEAAARALAASGAPAVPLVGLAKARVQAGVRSEERIILLERAEPLVLAEDDPALRILVKARDEAHRFAGRYQRKRRAATFGEGALDGIPGVGPARRKRLLATFGSVAALRAAPFEDLAAVPGIGERLARLLRERLAAGG